jgi:hypothetical protein
MRRHNEGKVATPPLSLAVKMWPTPTVFGNYNRKGLSKTSGDGLATAVKMWPTPTASDWKGPNLSGGESASCHGLSTSVAMLNNPQVNAVGGSLNPNWVEWLMGWPIGWTDCDASATDKSPKPWPWRGESFRSLDTASP